MGGIGAFVASSVPRALDIVGPAAFLFDARCIATPAAVCALAAVLFRDGVEVRAGHWAVAILRTRDPRLATFVVRPGMDHHFDVYPTPQAAFAEEGGVYDSGAAAAIVEWLRARESPSGPR